MLIFCNDNYLFYPKKAHLLLVIVLNNEVMKTNAVTVVTFWFILQPKDVIPHLNNSSDYTHHILSINLLKVQEVYLLYKSEM